MVSTSVGGWSVPVRVEDIPETGRRFDLVPSDAIRDAVGRAVGVERLPRLEAHFDVSRHGRDGLNVVGTVSATVGQTCVVTLEPMETEVEEKVNPTFLPGPKAASEGGSQPVEIAPTRDPPDAMAGGRVDLGAVATEFLILGIDPYPRKADAVFASPPALDDPASHPFAALAALKARKSQ